MRWSAPGIMGWYAWLPWMECDYRVLSLDHNIQADVCPFVEPSFDMNLLSLENLERVLEK